MPENAATLPRTQEGLRAVAAALDRMLDAAGAPPALAYGAHLVAEEIFSNLVKYGQPVATPDVVTLSLWAGGAERAVTLIIEDKTAPFSPVWAPHAPQVTDLATAQPGGLGLSLVRQTATELSYDSLPEGNRLVARFTG